MMKFFTCDGFLLSLLMISSIAISSLAEYQERCYCIKGKTLDCRYTSCPEVVDIDYPFCGLMGPKCPIVRCECIAGQCTIPRVKCHSDQICVDTKCYEDKWDKCETDKDCKLSFFCMDGRCYYDW